MSAEILLTAAKRYETKNTSLEKLAIGEIP